MSPLLFESATSMTPGASAGLMATSIEERRFQVTGELGESRELLKDDDLTGRLAPLTGSTRRSGGAEGLETDTGSTVAEGPGMAGQPAVTWQHGLTQTAAPAGPSASAQRILRVHFAREMLRSLEGLAGSTGEPIAARYASSFLRTARRLRDVDPYDPYVEVVMALHDALAFENRWAEVPAEMCRGAIAVVGRLSTLRHVDDAKAEKAIMELEKLGFDTTPFGMGMIETLDTCA